MTIQWTWSSLLPGRAAEVARDTRSTSRSRLVGERGRAAAPLLRGAEGSGKRPVRLAYQPPASSIFSQNKPATSNQPTILFSQNKPAPAINHRPKEQAKGPSRRRLREPKRKTWERSGFSCSREISICLQYSGSRQIACE
jgi:hypothetical protein